MTSTKTDRLARVGELGAALGAATALALVWGLAGLSQRGLEHLEAARQAGRAAREGGWQRLVQAAHPGLDLAMGLLIQLVPATNLRAIWLAHLGCALAIVALVWRIARPLAGRAGAASAALLALCVPSVAAELVAPATTLPVMVMWLGVWALATHPRPRWPHALGLWLLGGLWLLSWSPMLTWCVLLLLATLGARARPAPTPGRMGPSSLPVALALAPLLVPLTATLLHPGLWSDPAAGWLALLEAGWLKAAPDQVLAGAWRPGGRLPWFAGPWMAWRELPAALGLGGLAGAWALRRRLRHDPNARILVGSVPLLLALPWVLPGGHYGRVDTMAMLALPLSMLSGVALGALVRAQRPAARPIVTGAVALALLSGPALATSVYYPSPGLWRSAASGGPREALRRGRLVPRERALPRTWVRRSAQVLGARPVDVGEWALALEEYERLGDDVPARAGPGAPARLVPLPRWSAPPAPRPAFSIPEGAETHTFEAGGVPAWVLIVE